MVLSPIEPVAPRTVTERTADAAALLLRKGTALMSSPNHKTAADAIHAAPQKAKNRSHDDCGDEAVETIHQPAMPGNQVAGVLDAEPPLHRGFEEITELGSNRKRCAQQQNGDALAETECYKSSRDGQARHKATDGARPCFLRTDP